MAVNLLDWRQQKSRLKIRGYGLATAITACVMTTGLLFLRNYVDKNTTLLKQDNAFIQEKMSELNIKLTNNTIEKRYYAISDLLKQAYTQLTRQTIRLALITQLSAHFPSGINLNQLQINSNSLTLTGSGQPYAVAKLVLALSKFASLANANMTALSHNHFTIVSTIIYPKPHAT